MRFENDSSVRMLESAQTSAKSNVKRNSPPREAQAEATSFLHEMKDTMSHRPAPVRNEPRQIERERAHERAERPDRDAPKRDTIERAERPSQDQRAERTDRQPEKTDTASQPKQAKDTSEQSVKSSDATAPDQGEQVQDQTSVQLNGAKNLALPADAALAEDVAQIPELDADAQKLLAEAKVLQLPGTGAQQAATPQITKAQFEAAANENETSPLAISEHTKTKLTAKLADLAGQVSDSAEPTSGDAPKLDGGKILPFKVPAIQADKLEAAAAKTEVVRNFVEQMQAKAEKQAPAIAQQSSQGQIVALGATSATQNSATSTAIAQQPHLQHAVQTATMDALPFHVKRAVDQGRDILEIRLDPADLGKIEIRLERTSDNKILTHITADRPETLQMLQKDSSTLTKDMQNAGVNLDAGGMQFSLRQDNPEARRNGQADLNTLPNSTDQVDDQHEIPLSLIQNAAAYNRLYIPGRVDMQV